MIQMMTCSSPVNIALVKYWGKRDTELLLPTNDSLSITLDQLYSTTTIAVSSEFTQDTLWLNASQQPLTKRIVQVLKEAREIRSLYEQENNLPPLSRMKCHISSVNNFPTAAGLASSASGLACLAFTLHQLLELPLNLSELSRLARLGSGSACRSLMGGFVAWEMGSRPDGLDSLAVQIADAPHWPDMEALILVVSDLKKDVGSTMGMQSTVETSPLLQERIRLVPQTMQRMKHAILNKDFDSLAEITMRDSNQFHSVCLDTYPPIFYMNDISHAIIRLITEYNQVFVSKGLGYRAAYTFDAGPNAVLFLPRAHVPQMLSLIQHFFPMDVTMDSQEYLGRSAEFLPSAVDKETLEIISSLKCRVQPPGALKKIMSTGIGSGPRVLARGYDASVSLLNEQGYPMAA